MKTFDFGWFGVWSFAVCFFLVATVFAEDLVFPDANWETATPESMGVDSQLLATAISQLPNSTRTMVIRDGRVIWQGNSVDVNYAVWSVTKSFASTAVGLLVDDGLMTVDSKVADYIPELAERYPDLTFEHLLKQSGGISGNFLSPGVPLFEPGSQFVYNLDADNHALSFAMSEVAGKSFEDLIISRIAKPIGMDLENIEFETLTQRSRERDAVFQRANHGLQISASDLARYGLLYLNEGVWDGQRLLSEEWIEGATQVQVRDVPNNAASIGNFVDEFGYGWWILDKGGQFNAFGFDNNQLMIDPISGFVVSSVGAGGSQASFITGLEAAQIPHVWTRGTGDWHEVDAAGQTRWTFNGESSSELPRGKATLLGGTVNLQQPLATRSILLQNDSKLRVLEPAELLAREIIAEESSSLQVSGQMSLTNLEISGAAVFESTSNVSADTVSVDGSELLVNGAADLGIVSLLNGAKLVVDGELSYVSGPFRNSTIEIHNGDSPLQVAGAVRPGGESTIAFVLDGPSWSRPLSVRGKNRR